MASEKYDIAYELIVERKFVAKDEAFRARFIMDLQVPTYQKMRKVMFHDVLMKLCQQIVKLHYESSAKKKMRKSLAKLMDNNKLSPDSDTFKNELDNQL